MATDAKTVRRRLNVLELADKIGNVSEACRRRGITRTQFYEYKKRYETLGLEGLADLPPIAKSHPQTTPSGTVAKICDLALAHPGRGYNYLQRLLGSEDVHVSAVTIRKILYDHELSTRVDRWLRLERQYADMGQELTREQVDYLEKQNPAFRERNVESSKPGEFICQGVWPIANLDSIHKAYVHAVVDSFDGFAFGRLDPSNKSDAALALLRDQVLPFYRNHALKVETVHTDIRGRLRHERLPAPHGVIDRFRQTANREFFALRSRARRHATLGAHQIALDAWLHDYNYELPYLGFPNHGQTPNARLKQYLANLPVGDTGTASSVISTAR